MKWILLSILGINLCIFFYLIDSNRYLAYGLDTLRELGKANRLRQVHLLPDYSPERLGLPLTGAITAELFRLNSSQTLIIPLLLYLIGGSITWFLLFRTLTGNNAISSTAVFLNLITLHPGYMSANPFFAAILFPLRIMLRQKKGLVVFVLAIFSQFTYPILALVTDIFIFGYFLWLWWYRGYRPLIGRVVLASQLVAIITLYLFYCWLQHNWILPESFFTSIYLLSMTPFAIDWVSAAIVLFYSFHLIFFIPGVPRIKKSLSTLIPSKIKYNQNVSFALTLILITLILIPWFPALTSPYLSFSLEYYLALLAAGIGIMRINIQPIHPLFKFTALFVAAYTLMILILTKDNPNHFLVYQNRFTLIISPFVAVFILSALKQYQRHFIPIYILLIVVQQLPLYTQFYSMYFKDKADVEGIKAALWLNQQPDSTNVIYASPYFAQNALTPHEKYESMYYSASIIPWADQQRLGKCDPIEPQCIATVLDYARIHNVRYIVIKGADSFSSYEYYRQAGEVIYDQAVKIIRLK